MCSAVSFRLDLPNGRASSVIRAYRTSAQGNIAEFVYILRSTLTENYFKRFYVVCFVGLLIHMFLESDDAVEASTTSTLICLDHRVTYVVTSASWIQQNINMRNRREALKG